MVAMYHTRAKASALETSAFPPYERRRPLHADTQFATASRNKMGNDDNGDKVSKETVLRRRERKTLKIDYQPQGRLTNKVNHPL